MFANGGYGYPPFLFIEKDYHYAEKSANYVFRKKTPMLRIYADNVLTYAYIVARLPDTMKDTVNYPAPRDRAPATH